VQLHSAQEQFAQEQFKFAIGMVAVALDVIARAQMSIATASSVQNRER